MESIKHPQREKGKYFLAPTYEVVETVAEERIWKFPIVDALRDAVRSRTPGALPPKTEEHPIVGLWHDVTRLVRRRVFGGRGGI
jgi:hypothetical protein